MAAETVTTSTTTFCPKCHDKTACSCGNVIWVRTDQPTDPNAPVNIFSPLSYSPIQVAPLGWKCPDCTRIYSPLMSECVHCNAAKVYLRYATGTGSTPEGR